MGRAPGPHSRAEGPSIPALQAQRNLLASHWLSLGHMPVRQPIPATMKKRGLHHAVLKIYYAVNSWRLRKKRDLHKEWTIIKNICMDNYVDELLL